MSEIVEIIDTLEIKILKLVEKIEASEKKNQELHDNIEKATSTIQNQDNHILELERQLETLKMANALLGSNDYKKDTKLKINTLVKEIDYCIGQLSE